MVNSGQSFLVSANTVENKLAQLRMEHGPSHHSEHGVIKWRWWPSVCVFVAAAFFCTGDSLSGKIEGRDGSELTPTIKFRWWWWRRISCLVTWRRRIAFAAATLRDVSTPDQHLKWLPLNMTTSLGTKKELKNVFIGCKINCMSSQLNSETMDDGAMKWPGHREMGCISIDSSAWVDAFTNLEWFCIFVAHNTREKFSFNAWSYLKWLPRNMTTSLGAKKELKIYSSDAT